MMFKLKRCKKAKKQKIATSKEVKPVVEQKSVKINLKQQDEIIKAILGDSTESNGEVSSKQRKIFLRKLSKGEIDDEALRKVLLKLKVPSEQGKFKKGRREIFDAICEDEYLDAIFRGSLNIEKNWTLTVWQVDDFMQRFPTPLDFGLIRNEFLIWAVEENIDAEWAEKLDLFEKIVYGKRLDYCRQMGLLLGEAIK